MKTGVYSWRLSTDLKAGLERAARSRNMSMSAVLDLAAREWLDNSGTDSGSAEEQLRLHKAAFKCLGAFAGADTRRSEDVRQSVRQRLRQRHAG